MRNHCFLAFAVLILLCFVSTAAFSEVVIIANNSVAESTISQNDLKKIFLGKTVKWPDKSSVNFVILKSGETHKKFVKTIVSKSPSQFKNYWKNMVFTGKGSKPKTFANQKDLIKYVSDTEGAIGYAEKGSTIDNVKIINVN